MYLYGCYRGIIAYFKKKKTKRVLLSNHWNMWNLEKRLCMSSCKFTLLFENVFFFNIMEFSIVATCAQVVGSSLLVPDRRSGGGVTSEFPLRCPSCSHNEVISVSLGTVPWEQAPTIGLDRLVDLRWFSLAGKNHLDV